ncbi:MAG: acyl--CoA ligase, partial [Halioglobus sp.]|nr:acyl--CoA ligase [Halioglobus sp.]
MTALSELHGIPLAEEPDLGPLTLPGFIAEIAKRHGAREALRWQNLDGEQQSWTYAEMYDESLAVARALLAVGVGRGTRVGLLVSNRPEWLFSMFGAAIAGAVTVALNTFSTKQELAFQLRQSDIELLIMEAGVASRDFVSDIFELCPGLATAAPGQLQQDDLPFLRRVICLDKALSRPGLQDWDAFLALGEQVPAHLARATAEASSPIDLGMIFFSSGSTAQPKAIQQSHRAATLQCWRFGHWYEADSSVRTWSANGFFWSGNFAMAFGSTLTVGGCLVLQRYFDPDAALELIQKEKISMAIAWPHQEARLKECPGWNHADLSALHYVDAQLILATHPTINTTWRQPNGYGLTETFTFVTGFSGRQNTDNTYGPVLPGNIVRIVDPDTGAILPMGETGEIIAKGPTLTPGYLKTPPEELLDPEGFIHTEDAGYFTPAGHLFWIGRMGDIIKTGGANVSPAEIDAVLVKHDAIASAFSLGVPHETLGEIVVSCVVLSEGKLLDEEAVRAFARQSLASYKIPREVLFFTDGELPMTGSNKIQRPQLRKMVVARLEAVQHH